MGSGCFDFFVVIFLIDTLAANFDVDKKAIVWTISIALAMRPVGALIFGALADRFGRRRPLIACVLYFSAATLLSAFAPNYATFVVLRALYGIGMGGYWGIGASLAVESAPRQRRGLISGLMQSGYPHRILAGCRWRWKACCLIWAGGPCFVLVSRLRF